MWFNAFFKARAAAKAPQKTLQVTTLPGAAEIFAKLKDLPRQSRSLFMPEPLQNSSLLLGREKHFEMLLDALQRWQQGKPASIALIGLQGSGKTSLINCLHEKYTGNRKIIKSDISQRLCTRELVIDFFKRLFNITIPCRNIDELIEQMVSLDPMIIVIEGGHQVLLRVIGGSGAAEAFFYILLRTRLRHLWIMTCRRFAWDNMDRILGAARYFSHLIDVDCISEEDMRNAMALRLKNSGLDVIFCDKDDDFDACREKKARKNQKSADDYYRALLTNSGRNFHSALYFMLLGSQYDTATDSLYLRPADPIDMSFVKDLDHLLLLALAEIAGHGTLSISEHMQIFRTDEIQSRSALEYLVQVKLAADVEVSTDSHGRIFELSPITHHAVASSLAQLNLIY